MGYFFYSMSPYIFLFRDRSAALRRCVCLLLFFFGIIPLFHFYYFAYFKATSKPLIYNQYTKVKLETRRIYYVYRHVLCLVMTSLYNVTNFKIVTNALVPTFGVRIRSTVLDIYIFYLLLIENNI